MRLRTSAVRFGAVALVAALVLAGCQAAAPSQPPAGLTVFGAASLTDVLEDIKAEWERTHGQSGPLTISTGSSSALRTQIEEGAPVDVFLSADTSNPQALADAGMVDGDVVPFAGNRLVLIVPEGNPAGITGAADLARDGVCVIAAGENVPITRYTTQLVEALAGTAGMPADFAAGYAANVCSNEDDVRAVLTKIELGEGDAAIVYATDALSSDVETVDLPAGVEIKARYGGVVLDESTNLEVARELLSWIAGADGQAILANHGFVAAD